MNRAHLIRAIVGWKDNEAPETQGTTGRKGLGVLCVSFITEKDEFLPTGFTREEEGCTITKRVAGELQN